MLSSFALGAMFGERVGNEPTRLIGLHGWRRSHADLAKVVDGFDAISLDLPGFGASPVPSVAWNTDLYAQLVAKVIEDLPAPVVLFGHSFGGRVAVSLAAQRPDLVNAIVLCGVPLIRKPSTAKAPFVFRAAKWANNQGFLSDELMERQRRKHGSADYRAATGTMRDIFVRVVNESYEHHLPNITCPVEMVWGESDTEAPLAQARVAAELIKDCTMTVIPGGSHWLPSQNPEPLREAIRKHLP